MITALRSLFGSTLGKAIAVAFIAIIGIGFGLADITGQSGSSGIGRANAARVGDQDVGIAALRERVRSAYDQARQQQPNLTMAAFVESGGLDRTLDQLVSGLAFEQLAEKIGLGVSKRQIDGRIADIPAFAGVSGTFDETRFRAFLRENNMTEAQLRHELKQQLLLEQLGVPVGSMPYIPAGMAQPYAALTLEKREGQAVFIPSSAFAPTGDPGDAALKDFLAKNRTKFTIPERRVIQYAEFDRSAVTAPAVTDAEIAAAYKANAARYAASETRRFAQVIAPDQKTADAIAAKVRGGATLAAAAQSAGLSASTSGELTQDGYAAMTSADMARSGFTAQRGAVLGPVQTGLGWIVARVEAVTAKPARSLADATPELRADIAKTKANDAIVSFYNEIQDAVTAGTSIEEIATERKLKLAETPALLGNGRAPDAPAYALPPELAALVAQAFQATGEGDVQLATLVENEKFAVFSVKTIVAAAPPPFDRIRADLLTEWRFAEGQKVARDKARTIVKAVEGGQELAAAARATGGGIGTVQTIGGRRGELGAGGKPVPPELALLCSMAKGSVKTLEIPGNRGWMVLSLTQVQRPDPKSIDTKEVVGIAQPLASLFGNELVEQLAAEARRRVGVKINKELVEQLRQELTGATPAGE